jgi:hypothetical protein
MLPFPRTQKVKCKIWAHLVMPLAGLIWADEVFQNEMLGLLLNVEGGVDLCGVTIQIKAH